MCCGGSCSAGSDVVVFKYEVLLFVGNVVMFCMVTHVHICIDVMEELELWDSH